MPGGGRGVCVFVCVPRRVARACQMNCVCVCTHMHARAYMCHFLVLFVLHGAWFLPAIVLVCKRLYRPLLEVTTAQDSVVLRTGGFSMIHSTSVRGLIWCYVLCAQVWMVPCGPRGDKSRPLSTSTWDRYLMCVLAVEAAVPAAYRVRVAPIEAPLPAALPCIDLMTLVTGLVGSGGGSGGGGGASAGGSDGGGGMVVSSLLPRRRRTRFVIGDDLVPGLGRWVRAPDLLRAVHFLVVRRPGFVRAAHADASPVPPPAPPTLGTASSSVGGRCEGDAAPVSVAAAPAAAALAAAAPAAAAAPVGGDPAPAASPLPPRSLARCATLPRLCDELDSDVCIDLSSSLVRGRIAAGLDVTGMVAVSARAREGWSARRGVDACRHGAAAAPAARPGLGAEVVRRRGVLSARDGAGLKFPLCKRVGFRVYSARCGLLLGVMHGWDRVIDCWLELIFGQKRHCVNCTEHTLTCTHFSSTHTNTGTHQK